MILYEDNHLLVVHKPSGILVQGDRTGDKTIVDDYRNYIRKKYDKKGNVFLHPAHRLDRPVSGCLILARTSKGLSRMTELFRKGEVHKIYHVLSDQRSTESTELLVNYLVKDTTKNQTRLVGKNKAGAKRVELRYRHLASQGQGHLYEIHPMTGRSHQIRVQMAGIRCPILGDLKYGGTSVSDSRMIYLHCTQMTFKHPTKPEDITVHCTPSSGVKWKSFIPFMTRS